MDRSGNTRFGIGQIKDSIKPPFFIKDMEKNYQKRIEKISQAIYLVSNHLKDNEPLKYELRKECLGFLSCIRSIEEGGEGSGFAPDIVVEALSTYAKDLVSYISLAVVAGLISRNNGALITQEIDGLMSSFTDTTGVPALRPGLILSQEFFATDPEMQQHFSAGGNKGQNNLISDKSSSLYNEKIPFPPKVNNKTLAQQIDSIKDKKNERQVKILTLLRARPNLSIKDFSSVIPDCSEKTIQRELLELVEKGVIKKEGERRWSTYSLK